MPVKLAGGAGKVKDRNPVIDVAEKSDTPVVLGKPPNNGKPAEAVEGRGVAEGNAGEAPAGRTQRRETERDKKKKGSGTHLICITRKEDLSHPLERVAAELRRAALRPFVTIALAGGLIPHNRPPSPQKSVSPIRRLPRRPLLPGYFFTNASGSMPACLRMACSVPSGMSPG